LAILLGRFAGQEPDVEPVAKGITDCRGRTDCRRTSNDSLLQRQFQRDKSGAAAYFLRSILGLLIYALNIRIYTYF